MGSSTDPQLELWQGNAEDIPPHARCAPDQRTPGSPLLLPPCQALQQLALPERQAQARQCLVRLGAAPTDHQWEMILAPTTSTYVIAGAGSGKSTTLILRLLVMHKLLGICNAIITHQTAWRYQPLDN